MAMPSNGPPQITDRQWPILYRIVAIPQISYFLRRRPNISIFHLIAFRNTAILWKLAESVPKAVLWRTTFS
jgi:hypothetical protein